MALLNRLGSSLALSLRLSSRQFAACQGAAIHMSSVTEARRRKQEESDDESDAEAETPSVVARQPAEDDEVEWPPAIDQSQLRSLGGEGCRVERRRCRLPPAAARNGAWFAAAL